MIPRYKKSVFLSVLEVLEILRDGRAMPHIELLSATKKQTEELLNGLLNTTFKSEIE